MAGGFGLFDLGVGLWGANGAAEPATRTPTDAPTGNGLWLLDLVIGGRTLRYATKRTTVLDRFGVGYLYQAGLQDFEIALDGLEEQQAVSVLDFGVDWPALAAAGHALELARATLRRLEPGQLLESARIVLIGQTDEPEYGDPETPALLTVGVFANLGTDRTWPAPSERVDQTTWAYSADLSATTYDQGTEGAIYATIFGFPGEGDTTTTEPIATVPAILVDWDQGALYTRRLLIARGELACVGGVVRVVDEDDEASGFGYAVEDENVVVDTDLLGQTVTLVEIPPGAGVQGILGHKYYVGLSRDTGRGGGSSVPGIGSPLSTLADVALFCGRNSGRIFDERAQEIERVYLDNYRIDGVLNNEVQLVPWFESEIMPLFPIARTRSSQGMYWRFVNWWAQPADAREIIDTSKGEWRRVTSIRSPTDSVRNYFTIDFQLRDDRPGARRILTALSEQVLPWWYNPDMISDVRIAGTSALGASQTLYGLREAEPISSAYLWKETTASRSLHYRAVRDSFARRPVSYQGPARTIAHLRPWDPVIVNDAQVSLSNAVGLVRAVRLSSDRLAQVDLEILDPRRLG